MNKQIIIDNSISYTAILVSLISLVISIRSCIREDEAFDWTKKQTELENRISIGTSAAWAPGHIFISKMAESQFLGGTASGRFYSGVDAPLNINISNNGKYGITIENIKWGYIDNSGALYFPWSTRFVTQADNDSIAYPISLEPRKSITVRTRVPVPVSMDIADQLNDLTNDTVYSSQDLLIELLAKKIIGRPVNNEIFRWLKDTLKTSGLYWNLEKSASGLPSVLIEMSDPNNVVRRGDRRIEIQYLLASGVSIRDTIDYMDVYAMSMWADNGVGYMQIGLFLDECTKTDR